MKYKIAEPKECKQKFAWLPRRIGPFRIWLERYEVRHVPVSEAIERYPMPYYSDHVAYWLEEFRYGGASYWRLTRAFLFSMGSLHRSWVVVKPSLKVIVA